MQYKILCNICDSEKERYDREGEFVWNYFLKINRLSSINFNPLLR